jgi:hypothetical protein
MMHLSKMDETGWRVNWPDRGRLMLALEGDTKAEGLRDSDFAGLNQIGNEVTPIESRSAFIRLRQEGVVKERSGRWYLKEAGFQPEAEPKESRPKADPEPRAALLALFPVGMEKAEPLDVIKKRAKFLLGMDSIRFANYRFNLSCGGVIHKTAVGNYYREAGK